MIITQDPLQTTQTLVLSHSEIRNLINNLQESLQYAIDNNIPSSVKIESSDNKEYIGIIIFDKETNDKHWENKDEN